MQNSKNKFYIPINWFDSLKYAFNGLKLIFKNERNFRIQLIIAVGVIIAGTILELSRQDWIGVSILIGLVLVAESLNSVVEAMCDTISQEYRVNIKYAKDVAAGAVLITTIVAISVGILIIWPYLAKLFEKVVQLLT